MTKPDPNKQETPAANQDKQPPASNDPQNQKSNNDRDWEASFKGLQGTVQKQSEELTSIKDLLGDITSKLVAPESDEGDPPPAPDTIEEHVLLLNQRIDDMNTQLTTAQAAQLQQARDNRKLTMLAEKPEVLPFSFSIPTLEDEAAQREAIDSFELQLNSFAEARKSPKPSSPPPAKSPTQTPPIDPVEKAQKAQQRWSEAVLDGKPDAEVAKLRDDFLAVSDKAGFLADWTYIES